MPKIFSNGDRAAIRNALLEAGKEQFQRYGLKKTNIEQLARAAGIAKGTFYNFFDSKEHLCMEIFNLEELEMRNDIERILADGSNAQETLEALFSYSMSFVKNNSLLTVLRETGEYSLLARGLGKERMSVHLQDDLHFLEIVFDDLRKKGIRNPPDLDVLAGVFRAVVMLAFHEDEIGADVFPAVMRFIMKWISTGMTEGDKDK